MSYAASRGVPVVLSSSLWLEEGSLRNYPLPDIEQILGFADVVVTNSISEQSMLDRFFPGVGEKCRPVYNGVDLEIIDNDTISDAVHAWGKQLPDRFVLCVGNIEPRKNQLLLTQAMEGLDIPLVLLGHIRDQKYWAQVQEAAKCELKYLGGFPFQAPEIYLAMRKSTVFTMPSTLETPSLAALEAAALGVKRIVITSIGSAFEYFGDRVLYVNPASVEDVRNGLVSSLATEGNSMLREHVRANFGWAKVCERLVGVYEELQQRTASR